MGEQGWGRVVAVLEAKRTGSENQLQTNQVSVVKFQPLWAIL